MLSRGSSPFPCAPSHYPFRITTPHHNSPSPHHAIHFSCPVLHREEYSGKTCKREPPASGISGKQRDGGPAGLERKNPPLGGGPTERIPVADRPTDRTTDILLETEREEMMFQDWYSACTMVQRWQGLVFGLLYERSRHRYPPDTLTLSEWVWQVRVLDSSNDSSGEEGEEEGGGVWL